MSEIGTAAPPGCWDYLGHILYMFDLVVLRAILGRGRLRVDTERKWRVVVCEPGEEPRKSERVWRCTSY